MNPDALAAALAGLSGVDESYLVDNQIPTDPLFGSIMALPQLQPEGPGVDYGADAPNDPLSMALSFGRFGDASAVEQGVEQSNLPLALMGLLGLAGTIKPIGRAAAEYHPDAVKLAQKRVVEPVVGAADDAATIAISDMAREMAGKEGRAAEMGLTVPAYHGTRKHPGSMTDFTAIEPAASSQYESLDRMLGFHAAADPEVASTFAKSIYPDHRGRVFPLRISNKISDVPQDVIESSLKPETDMVAVSRLVFNEGLGKGDFVSWYNNAGREALNGEISGDEAFEKLTAGGIIPEIKRSMTPQEYLLDIDRDMIMAPIETKRAVVKKARSALMDKGTDVLRYINTAPGEIERASNPISYIVLDPSRARSPWAAFDPAKKDSADLLAGVAPLLAPTALAAALSQFGTEDQ